MRLSEASFGIKEASRPLGVILGRDEADDSLVMDECRVLK